MNRLGDVVRSNSDQFQAGGNVVPFARPRPAAPRVAIRREAPARAAGRRVDDVADSAHDRTGAIFTLALFVLSSLFNAALLLAAFGVRLP